MTANSPKLVGPPAGHDPPRVEPVAAFPANRPGGGRRSTVIAVVTAAAVLAAGGGTAAWLTYRHHAATGAPQGQPAPGGTASQPTGNASAQPTPTATPAPSPALSQTPGGSGSLVDRAPGIVQDSETARIVAFANSYFTAINDHSFRNYDALLDPTMRENQTAQSFQSDFGTTTDSDATINAISAVRPGLAGATLTFVSHQSPTDSPTHTACTDWNITLYLRDFSGRYLLGPSPPGYQPAFEAC